jgi:hypothetical protein
MKRRDFIKVSSATGLAGMIGRGDPSIAFNSSSGAHGFDLHPFIREHPEAVFIHLTVVEDKSDAMAIYNAAKKLASEMFIRRPKNKGFSNLTKINCKPNWTCNGGLISFRK